MWRIMIFTILFFFISGVTIEGFAIREKMLSGITIKNGKNMNTALPLYGRYCGLGHNDKYGAQPIDVLDRACQIHDICTSAGLLTCFCNEQLYWIVSNIVPLNNNMTKTKDSILSYIYASLVGCKNYDRFDIQYIIGSTFHRGFNYLPFYNIKKKNLYISIDTLEDDNIYFLEFDNQYDYSQFTQIAYANPSVDIPYSKKIQGNVYYKLFDYNIIYSKKNVTSQIFVYDVTLDVVNYMVNIQNQIIKKISVCH